MAFLNSASIFKPSSSSLTELRIRLVMKYVAYCYLEMMNDGIKYDFSKRGKLQHEDFLRNGLVDGYLSQKKHKDYYKAHISDNSNVEIYFQKEENQTYSLDNTLSDDFIDISVKETKLSDILSGDTGDEIRFAIECKRINDSSDYTEYVKDIQKFADRPFTTFRLPFEGQIAFIENPILTHTVVSDALNTKLLKTTTITTNKYLTGIIINKAFGAGYESCHNRNHGIKQSFAIFHLLLDYSSVVI